MANVINMANNKKNKKKTSKRMIAFKASWHRNGKLHMQVNYKRCDVCGDYNRYLAQLDDRDQFGHYAHKIAPYSAHEMR